LSASNLKSTIGNPFIALAETPSTNSYAMECLQAGLAGHGSAFFTANQTAGKGQRGRTWLAEPGSSIAVSVIVDTGFLPLADPFPLSIMAALACTDFFSFYAGEETSIKWPNDLYWRDRKAGGILIENLIRGQQWVGAVVGMGINLNQERFPADLKNPVSLKQITGRSFDASDMAKVLCTHLEKRYQELRNGAKEVQWEMYNRRLFKKGASVKLKNGPIAFEAVITGVSRSGELEVSGAPKEQYTFGEVSWELQHC